MRRLLSASAVLIPCAAVVLACAIGVVSAQEPAPTELQSLKENFRRPAPPPVENAALVALGRDLFWDPALSATGKTSCGGCHLPQFGWATPNARDIADSGKPTSRRSQTVIGMGYMTGPFGWDGRNATLEAQAVSSVGTGSMSLGATKTPVKVATIVERIGTNADYARKFKEALPERKINLDAIVIALAAFERTIEPTIAPFDRWIEGDETAISPAAKRGFVLFNGKGNCVGCHSGWRFTDDRFHDIGTSTTDRGRGREIKDDEMMQFAFKTPTLRDLTLRAPFMHHGEMPTLSDVIEHYVKGGIARPSRSPLMQSVALNEQERSDLIAFLETLTGEPASSQSSSPGSTR